MEKHTYIAQIPDQEMSNTTLWDILPEITDTIDDTTNLLNVRKKDVFGAVDDSCENTTVLHRHGILDATLINKKV